MSEDTSWWLLSTEEMEKANNRLIIESTTAYSNMGDPWLRVEDLEKILDSEIQTWQKFWIDEFILNPEVKPVEIPFKRRAGYIPEMSESAKDLFEDTVNEIARRKAELDGKVGDED